MRYVKLLSQLFLLIGLFFIGSQINLNSLFVIKPNTIFLALLLWFIAIPSSFFIVQNII